MSSLESNSSIHIGYGAKRKQRLPPLPSTTFRVPDTSVLDQELPDVQENSFEPSRSQIDPWQRVLQLEKALQFVKDQHSHILKALHAEVDLLKRKNRDLQMQLVLKEGPIKPGKGVTKKITEHNLSNKQVENLNNVPTEAIEVSQQQNKTSRKDSGKSAANSASAANSKKVGRSRSSSRVLEARRAQAQSMTETQHVSSKDQAQKQRTSVNVRLLPETESSTSYMKLSKRQRKLDDDHLPKITIKGGSVPSLTSTKNGQVETLPKLQTRRVTRSALSSPSSSNPSSPEKPKPKTKRRPQPK